MELCLLVPAHSLLQKESKIGEWVSKMGEPESKMGELGL